MAAPYRGGGGIGPDSSVAAGPLSIMGGGTSIKPCRRVAMDRRRVPRRIDPGRPGGSPSMSNQMRGLDFDLGEVADMLRDQVESFAADEIAPRAAAIDAANDFPADLWPKLGSLGLLGVTVSPEYGGAGMRYLEHVV